MQLPRLVVICGATATGKTTLSLQIADRLGNVEILGADSRQVYRGMDIGTAKVSREERARVPHHGLDLVYPDEPFTVADYQRHALAALHEIGSRSATPLLVGGTGLYLRAVVRGFTLTGAPDPEQRRELETIVRNEGIGPLADELARIAPRVAALTDLANPRRVIRALERVRVLGDRPGPAPAAYPAPVLWLGLRLDTREHRPAIEERARGQFAGGLLEEADTLRRSYAADLPAFSAFGYREAMSVLRGEADREYAIRTTTRRTWAYARRQRTWFRSEPEIQWLDVGSATLPRALERIDRFLVTD